MIRYRKTSYEQKAKTISKKLLIAKEYYENNIEKLHEQARNQYRYYSQEETKKENRT